VIPFIGKAASPFYGKSGTSLGRGKKRDARENTDSFGGKNGYLAHCRAKKKKDSGV